LDDDVFAALGNARRREILDLLRQQPGLKAGEVAAAFNEVSEPAVARHLRVLRKSGLVRTTRHGREAKYTVNAEPLIAAYRGYLAAFVPLAEQSLANLREAIARDTQP
jgi:DNA-binding transcriptional ArsR family regulator